MKGNVKAVGMFSGGLDSALAIKILQEQGIEAVAFNFSSPFNCFRKGENTKELAEKLGAKLKVFRSGKEYLELIKKPKHGYGKNMNPCIDCRAYIMRKAKEYADGIGAKFIFTGEVAGQRPMSQQKGTMMLIDKEAGLQGKVLRPLSAKLLPETDAEKEGLVKRERLMAIEGRRRVEQIKLAEKLGISGFNYGGSGCKLTDPAYAIRIRDLFENDKNAGENEILLLDYGRHFRLGKAKIIVGRNEEENKAVLRLKNKGDMVLEAEKFVGPTTILTGRKTKKAVGLAARITARYCDSKDAEVEVKYKTEKDIKVIRVTKASEEEIKEARV